MVFSDGVAFFGVSQMSWQLILLLKQYYLPDFFWQMGMIGRGPPRVCDQSCVHSNHLS